jgi:phage terminase small subunit
MTRGRVPVADEDRAGHRAGVGQGEAIEVSPIDSRLIGIEPPEDMSPLAREVWKVCVADMAVLGHLREPDLFQLRNYATEVAIAIECEASIQEFGAMMKEPILVYSQELGAEEMVGWKLKPNPACKLHREASNVVRLLATELALTPLARIRGNLMAAATASIALGIRASLESDLDEEDAIAKAARAPRKRKAPPKAAKPPAAKRARGKK